ncbi:MAG TPA: tyrosine-type recombinase/integrase [Bryobacteraceae bacterium]|nr:tyrosine-type recombinase/integrase [Bryobacteraceae bacterium]
MNVDGSIAYKPTTETVGAAEGPRKMGIRAARVEALKIVARANAASASPARGLMTFGQFVESRFVPEHVERLTVGGQGHYLYLLKKHILPSLSERQMQDITTGVIQMLLSAKAAAGLSKQTVTHIRNVFSAVFRHARLLGYWRGDPPTEGVKCHGKDAAPSRSLSADQLQKLIAEMPPKYAPLIALLAATGVRVGEALGLQWRYVNMTDQSVSVEGVLIPRYSLAVVQTFSRNQWGAPKTPRSRRVVPLTSEAWAALTEMRERDLTGGASDPVFRGDNGRPWNAHNLASRTLKKAGARAGVPWVFFHSIRHSLADCDPAIRQRVLGHTTAAMSLRYTHVDIEKVRAQLERGSN